jgi:methylglyoxal synthase
MFVNEMQTETHDLVEQSTEPRLQKRIALVAHDHKKQDLLEWARYNRLTLAQHEIFATGTTGRLLEQELHIHVNKLQSGPLGGDQQIGAKIAEGTIDVLIFFWDPLRAQPHDPDVKALLRIAVVWNIPIACNRTTADYMISSPLMATDYRRRAPDYEAYLERTIELERTEELVAGDEAADTAYAILAVHSETGSLGAAHPDLKQPEDVTKPDSVTQQEEKH